MYSVEKILKARHCINCKREIKKGEKVLAHYETNKYGQKFKFSYCVPRCAIWQINRERDLLFRAETMLFGSQGA